MKLCCVKSGITTSVAWPARLSGFAGSNWHQLHLPDEKHLSAQRTLHFYVSVTVKFLTKCPGFSPLNSLPNSNLNYNKLGINKNSSVRTRSNCQNFIWGYLSLQRARNFNIFAYSHLAHCETIELFDMAWKRHQGTERKYLEAFQIRNTSSKYNIFSSHYHFQCKFDMSKRYRPSDDLLN